MGVGYFSGGGEGVQVHTWGEGIQSAGDREKEGVQRGLLLYQEPGG